MFSKRPLPLALWVFLTAFAVRFLGLLAFSDSPHFLASGGDMRFYSDWAMRIAEGHFSDGKAFYGLPGYPYFLALVFATIGFDPFSVGFFQVISEAAVTALVFELARSIVPAPKGIWSGALAALGWIFFQPAQAFSLILMPTAWLVLAYWAIVWWSLRTRSDSLWRPWLWMGATIGLVATMIATILFVIPLPLLAAARNLRRRSAVLAAAGALIAGVFAGTSPCWMHNFLIAGEPVFLSAHSGVNFWIGNNPAATGYPKMPPGLRASQQGMLKDSILRAEEAAGRPLTRAEVSRFWSTKAMNYIKAHPADWLSLMATKVRNLGNAFQYDDLSIVTALAEDGILTPGLRFGWVAVLAIPGLVLASIRYPSARWIAVAVLLHFAALLPVFVTERYRLAAVPGLLILGSVGLVDFIQALYCRPPRWIQWAAIYLGLGLAGAWFVWLPLKDASLRALDDYNTGLKALQFGRLDQAREKLERAHAMLPDSAEVNFALGNLWLNQRDFGQAKRFYSRALELDPGTLGALNNLAIAALMEEEWSQAKILLSKSLRAEPDNAKTRYLLAYAEAHLANWAGAEAEIHQALALKPDQPEFQQLREAIRSKGPLPPLPLQP